MRRIHLYIPQLPERSHFGRLGRHDGLGPELRTEATLETLTLNVLSLARLRAALLSARGFARVHRSLLVAIGKIDHIEKNQIQIGDYLIPISDTNSKSSYRLLKGFRAG